VSTRHSARPARAGWVTANRTTDELTTPTDLLAFIEELAALADRRLIFAPHTKPAERRAAQLRDHLAGHLLPRARSLDTALLVLLIGPTGAGKSSLLNAVARRPISDVGVLRPTTTRMVLLVRPDDQAGVLGAGSPLASIDPSRIEIVADQSAPEGIALLDAPDIDSIAHANRALTDRLVEAADVGVFVTTATRYADRVPWDVLRRLRDRGLPLIVLVNRMPPEPRERAVILDHLRQLLAEEGIDGLGMQYGQEATGSQEGRTAPVEIITGLEGALDASGEALDSATIAPLRVRLNWLAADRQARRALAARALAGSIAGLGPLLQSIADDLDHEAIDADALRRSATDAFQAELGRLRDQLARGAFLRAEALRQWQSFVGADEITRLFSSGIGTFRATVSALIWGKPAAPVAVVRGETLADLAALARAHVAGAVRRTAVAWADEPATRDAIAVDGGWWAPSEEFDDRLARRLEAWMASIAADVQSTGEPKRQLARGASVGVNAAAVGVMLATFAHTGGLTGVEVGVAAGTAFLNQKLLEALFGEAAMVEIVARAKQRLGDALTQSFGEELERFERILADGAELRSLAIALRERAVALGRLSQAADSTALAMLSGSVRPLAWPEG